MVIESFRTRMRITHRLGNSVTLAHVTGGMDHASRASRWFRGELARHGMVMSADRESVSVEYGEIAVVVEFDILSGGPIPRFAMDDRRAIAALLEIAEEQACMMSR